jgi:hypothetical protein
MDAYLVWSLDQNGWYGPNRSCYVTRLDQAGRYPREEAVRICAYTRALPVREADALEMRAIERERR